MEKAAKPGRSLKSHLIKEYTDRLKVFSCLFVLDFGGTKNKEVEDLRRKLKTVSGDYIVVKNSLCRLALEKLKVTGVSDMVT